ncbi:MAG: 3-isopropylmalate dehydratase small subunit [Pseudomonadota bacterium]
MTRPLREIRSKTTVLPIADVDTDQIIPARFLTTTTREGLGKQLFHDWRYLQDGSPNPDFVLNQIDPEASTVLVADRNFGCGSSREHAPWALTDFGFQAVVSSEIADIFRSNSLKNGLLPIIVEENVLGWLLENPGADVVIDVAESTMTLPSGDVIDYPIDGFARHCLLEGIDQLGFLQQHLAAVEAFEDNRAWTP